MCLGERIAKLQDRRRSGPHHTSSDGLSVTESYYDWIFCVGPQFRKYLVRLEQLSLFRQNGFTK